MKRLLVLMVLAAVSCSQREAGPSIVIGSKNFTESVILGEILSQTLEGAGCRVDRRLNMGGTLVADKAISSGQLDAYVEYSGTALTAILHQPLLQDPARIDSLLRDAYRDRGLTWGPLLGFNNTFVMLVRADDARRLGLRTISDLKKVQDSFQPAFGPEFAARPDGYPGLLDTYDIEFQNAPKTMDLGLTYKALASGKADLIAGNSTDGLIESLGLVALADDRAYFPPYDAAIVYRADIDRKCAAASQALRALEGTIDERTMRSLNYEVDGRKRDVSEVAREFLGSK